MASSPSVVAQPDHRRALAPGADQDAGVIAMDGDEREVPVQRCIRPADRLRLRSRAARPATYPTPPHTPSDSRGERGARKASATSASDPLRTYAGFVSAAGLAIVLRRALRQLDAATPGRRAAVPRRALHARWAPLGAAAQRRDALLVERVGDGLQRHA